MDDVSQIVGIAKHAADLLWHELLGWGLDGRPRAQAAVVEFVGQILEAVVAGRVELERHGDEVGAVGVWLHCPSWTLPNSVESHTAKSWQEAFRNDDFRDLVAKFTVSYAPTTRLSTASPIQVVKFRYIGARAVPNRGIGAWLDFTPSTYATSAPSVGRAAREHLRILAPEGTFITGVTLVKEAPRSAGMLAPNAGSATYDARVSLERGVLYSSGIARDDGLYTAATTLRPNLRGLGLPAFLTLLSAAVLLGAGAFVQFGPHHLLSAHSEAAEPVIALFGVLFSLYSIYLSRPGEHEIRSQLLLVPRILILSTIPFVWSAAVIFIFGEDVVSVALGEIWAIVAGYCALIAIYLAIVLGRSRASRRRVRDGANSTGTFPLYTLISMNWDWEATMPTDADNASAD